NVTESNSGIGTTIRDAYLDAERNSSLNFLPGQIRLVVYGKDTAEIGIAPFFTLLVRDTRMPDMMFSAVSTTTAKQLLLEAGQLIDIDIGRYLQEL
ncbi:Ger(x)C family spore germination protein, partial [Picosynechococcus sp. PCC 7002]|uniref:Ger(x)C family spore germination protein n=1 Tax=Picosynechococcus sp. (strain ATCC 27264 / PCC 7002 / PR-6) TaxID=32049 RepID=UPI001C3D3085